MGLFPFQKGESLVTDFLGNLFIYLFELVKFQCPDNAIIEH